jgi:hypothetical protein
MSTLFHNPKIDDLQSEGFASLKEGTEVPANCSVVKRRRNRNRNDKRTGWQFRQSHVREKINFWNQAQRRLKFDKKQKALFEKLRDGARPSHVFTRNPDGTLKNDYERWVSIDGQESQRQSGIRRARENALVRTSPTAGLSGLKQYENGLFRSLAESYTADYIGLQLPDVKIRYAETSGAPAVRSATINRQPTLRQDDFHVDVGTKKFKIQLKGSGSWFKRLEAILGPYGTEKQFRRYRSDLLNLINEDVINQLQLSLGVDVREQLLSSTTSLWDWLRNNVSFDSKESFLQLYKRESNRFRSYLYKFAEAVFPRELKVIGRAVELFLYAKEQKPEVIDDVVDFYIDCLGYAMDELGYEDHVRSIHRQFFYWRKNRKQLRSLLPRRYQATKI